MKQSDIIRQQIRETEEAYDASIKRMVTDRKNRSEKNHDALWHEFWITCGNELSSKIDNLKTQLYCELKREMKVGDGATINLWSDRYACTVIKRTAKTLTVQRDKAILSPDFKPEWIPGGFSAHCTNADEQSYTYERNPDGEKTVFRWSEKHGRWQSGSDGSITLSIGRHEYYDYNF